MASFNSASSAEVSLALARGVFGYIRLQSVLRRLAKVEPYSIAIFMLD